ncbi:DUF3945 domain-containing protein [Hymenobacter setariae]|uniref:DUF3945 domain-containing protein n=1 Tax=Hymenobacter setariae TaxID=2594794 RepID=A0A558BJU0_9BACT|nr:DUF3945 domain-containing protein [Hymenobacter setariae]TVT36779.1 DUF3945 domain-containing protein [Hymenobacter setariae]
MAEQDEVPITEAVAPTPTASQVIYLNGLPMPDGTVGRDLLSNRPAHYSLFELRVDPSNPNRAEAFPAPNADAQLLYSQDSVLNRVFNFEGRPQPGQDFLAVQQPAIFERSGETWKMTMQGQTGFSNQPQQQQVPELASDVTTTAGPVREEAAASLGNQEPGSRIQVKWQQINDEVLPLDEMRLYLEGQGLHMDNPQGYQVGRGEDGKLTTSFHLKYDPAQTDPLKIEGAIQGLKELGSGNGLQVFENHEQEAARQKLIDPTQQASTRTVANELKRELAVSDWGTNPATLESLMSKAPAAAPTQEPAPDGTAPAVAAAPAAADKPAPEQAPAPALESSAGELQIKWKQQGDAVAPLLEMRAYLDQLKESGVAVGPMKFEKGTDGKLSGSFGVSYDPQSPELTKLEGTIQGLKRVGNGIEIVEKPEQVVARRQRMGVDDQDQATDLGYSVKEAFGVKQWDALSAQLSQAPKQALTGPEQAQQAAGVERVKQVAQQQGKSTAQVIQDGKSLLDIDTSGNPVSAFLKNFYEHLNGAPKTRQSLEVDYEKTRQDLQARLIKSAGNADAGDQLKPGARPEGVAPTAPAAAVAAAVAPEAPAPAATAVPVQQPATPAPAPKFTEADIPQKVLASLGLTDADLKANGQLQKLLNGEKTGLLAMQAVGKEGQEPVRFEAKMVLHREADGSATLKMELPKKLLEIPNEIGGQPFTPEQRKQLETEGTAGLVRGLKDKEGNTYNGYVGVDKEMNKVVVLPESKVTFKDEIAGVKLSAEQSHDLREGKAVHLAQMNRPNGGEPFDGTVQIHAAKAGVEVKPEPYELAKTQAPAATQTRDLDSEKKQAPVATVTEVVAPAPRVRGPRI